MDHHLPLNKYLVALCLSLDDRLAAIDFHQDGMAACLESTVRHVFLNQLSGPLVDALRDIIRHVDAMTLTPEFIEARLKPLLRQPRSDPPFG